MSELNNIPNHFLKKTFLESTVDSQFRNFISRHHKHIQNKKLVSPKSDSSFQYDAIRAYLKELDIDDNVWIGLSKTSEKPTFTWSNSRPMNGEGHWRENIPIGDDSLCVTMDPTADYLWKPFPCGGPEVASFICELSVPSWAAGPKGCLLTELPSLTVLYIPEQMAVELTSDCGLDGTKRIACKGNADREDILKQLTCAISVEDFEDKWSTKPSTGLSSIASEISSEMNSLNSRTTKSSIWTSNTIDIDYGMPTRHRRETENTLSPFSFKTTTDLSGIDVNTKTSPSEGLTIVQTSTSSNYDTEVTSVSSSHDAFLDTNTPHRFDSSGKSTATQLIDVSIQDVKDGSQKEEDLAITATTTIDTKAAGLSHEDIAEYPSAISQGQLFSIIENGTMFDIIELNETGAEDVKLSKDIISRSSNESTATVKVSTISATMPIQHENLYTTVVYYKEPPSDAIQVTNKSPKKVDKISKTLFYKKLDPKIANYPTDKNTLKQKDVRDLQNKEIDKSLTKEVEMFPLVGGSLVKLNRTYRKELPVIEGNDLTNENDYADNFGNKNLSGNTKFLGDHQHVLIKLHEEENKNVTRATFFVTTKRTNIHNTDNHKADIITTTKLEMSQNFTKTTELPKLLIDPKLEVLNQNVTENNESEIFMDKNNGIAGDYSSQMLKKKYLPKSLIGEIETNTASPEQELESETSDPSETDATESLDVDEPITQARPNRQRQLTRPQRRSFYPYFFSRVLG